MNKRIKELDALRGLAAVFVMLFHYTTLYNIQFGHESNYLFNFKYGYLGVNLFFMISGYVIYMTILKSNNIKEFIVKRAIRLYPAYILGVCLTYVFVSNYNLKDLKVTLIDFLFNLSMFQGVLPNSGIKLVDGAYWSLAVELTFYILCAVLLGVGLIKKPVLISLVSLLSILLMKFLFVIKILPPVINNMGIINYANLFIAGIMFFQLRSSKSIKYHLIILLSISYEILGYPLTTWIWLLGFFIIFYALIYDKLKFLNIRVLRYLGTISYSLYLIHQNIGYIIINFLEKNGLTNEVFLLIPFGISLSLATIITFYIEKPLQKYLLSNYYSKYKKDKRSEQVISA